MFSLGLCSCGPVLVETVLFLQTPPLFAGKSAGLMPTIRHVGQITVNVNTVFNALKSWPCTLQVFLSNVPVWLSMWITKGVKHNPFYNVLHALPLCPTHSYIFIWLHFQTWPAGFKQHDCQGEGSRKAHQSSLTLNVLS